MFPLISDWTVRAGQEKGCHRRPQTPRRAGGSAGKRYGCVSGPRPGYDAAVIADAIEPRDRIFRNLPEPSPAFETHVNGPVFQNFVKRHKRLFLCIQVKDESGKTITWPYSTVEFLTRQTGFIRPEATAPA